MTPFLDSFTVDARTATGMDRPLEAVIDLMARTLADPAAIPVPDLPENETMLFEDETVSIWHERFLPAEVLPPHDHGMFAVLGVYRGAESNRLYRPGGGALRPAGELILRAGEFHVFGPGDVHAVTALGGAPSLGLHVYLGPLTRVARSLYDWETGEARAMDGAAFAAMTRPA